MRDWRDVFDQLHIEARSLQRSDRAFTPRARALHADFNISHAELRRLFSCLLRSALAGERRALAASLEARRPCGCPAERIALGVRDGHGRVVERRVNVHDAATDVAAYAFLLVGLCHHEALINKCEREITIKLNKPNRPMPCVASTNLVRETADQPGPTKRASLIASP